MQYNSEANGQDLVSLANTLTGRTNTNFPLAEKTLYGNMANRYILSQIFRIYGGWKYDDKGHGNLPFLTGNLVADQDNYSLPNDIISLEGVYVQNETDTTWNKLYPINLEEIPEAEPEYDKTPATGCKYRVVGNSIRLYPPIDYSKDSALGIEISRDISAFVPTDTTKTPAFDQTFHEAVAVFMAYKYAQKHQLSNLKDLERQWIDYYGVPERNVIGSIGKHYARKFRDNFPLKMKQNYQLNDYI